MKTYTEAQIKARAKFNAKRTARAMQGEYNEIAPCVKAENAGRFYIRLIDNPRPAADEGYEPTYANLKSAGRAREEADAYSRSCEAIAAACGLR